MQLFLVDIGDYVDATMSPSDIWQKVNEISDGEKYKLLTAHIKQSSNFPKTFMVGRFHIVRL